MDMTTNKPYEPITGLSFLDDSTLLNWVFFNQFVQVEGRNDDGKSCSEPGIQMFDEFNSAIEQERNIELSDVYDVSLYEGKRIDDGKSCSEPGTHMHAEFNLADEQEKNTKRSNSDEPNIELADVYDVSFYEGRRIDDGKSCSKPEIHLFDDFNSPDVLEIPESEEDYKQKNSCKRKHKSRSRSKSRSSGESRDQSDNDYNIRQHRKKYRWKDKLRLPTNNLHLKQSAAKYKNNTANKNQSSDKRKMLSSNTSKDCEVPSTDSSDVLEIDSNTSNDDYGSSDSSDDLEFQQRNKKYRKSKKNVNKSKDMKPHVKEDLNEAIRNLKPERSARKDNINSPKSPQVSSHKSLRLAKMEPRNVIRILRTKTQRNYKEISESDEDYRPKNSLKKNAKFKSRSKSGNRSSDESRDQLDEDVHIRRHRKNFRRKNERRSPTPSSIEADSEVDQRGQDDKKKKKDSLNRARNHNSSHSSSVLREGKVNQASDKNNLHLKQSAAKYKNNIANKNQSSYKRKILPSDSSDDCEMLSPNSSDEWEMPSSYSSEMSLSDSSDVLDKDSNTSNDNDKLSDSSDHWRVSAKKKKDQKSKIGKLSEYEKLVQKNRDEKMAFLQSLRMNEVKEGLNEALRNLKPKRSARKYNSQKPQIPQDPSRRSLRLAKMDISSNKEVMYKGEKENSKEESSSILTFEKAYIEDGVYSDFVCDFDDLDFEMPQPITDYVSYFPNMKMDMSKDCKYFQGRIIALDFHPMKEKIILSYGNSNGAITFWHVNSSSAAYDFKAHCSKVSCLKFNSDALNQIVSCSYDGTMLCGDIEKKIFNKVLSYNSSCQYFDFISPTTTILSHRNGNISLVDIRTDSKSVVKSHKCHESAAMTVSVHPLNKNYFVSADTKGFISLWDLRDLQKKSVMEVNTQRKLIQSAFFSPISGNSILVTSPVDNSLCLFDSSKLGSDLSLYKKVWHNSKCGIISTQKATWLPNTDDFFVIGSDESNQKIKIFNNQLENIYNFHNENLIFTTSTVFHPSLPVLAAGNYQGKVCIFS